MVTKILSEDLERGDFSVVARPSLSGEHSASDHRSLVMLEVFDNAFEGVNHLGQLLTGTQRFCSSTVGDRRVPSGSTVEKGPRAV